VSNSQQRTDNPSRGRWRRHSLLALSVAVAVALLWAFIFDAKASPELASKLTHTVTRSDLVVTVRKSGLVESSENKEIKCKVRGQSTVIWVIDSGTYVEPGDELVRLDTLRIEEAVAERTKYAHWSRSSAERSRANVAAAELAISEYEEGRYRSEMMTLEKDLAIAESDLRTAKDRLDYFRKLVARDYVVELEVEQKALAVTRAELEVGVKATEIETLKDYTKAMELETLKGNLKAAIANLAAAEERSEMDATRRNQALEELELCVVSAETSGMVIHPSAARWHNAPKIAEGESVHKDQVLLLMPDLSKMQVKLGINESHIDRVKPGQAARVTLPNRTLDGTVSTVASVTAPPAIWNGYKVEYETMVALPPVKGLMPGMSAEVEIIAEHHANVLTVPVAAVVEMADGNFCWVKTPDGVQQRSVQLGDTNDVHTVVTAGVKEGDEVMLNPLAFIDETQREALVSDDEPEFKSAEANTEAESQPKKPNSKKQTSKPGNPKVPEQNAQ
jgi:HlyD family secretion protein